jgi:outer membrane receptor protein involved in Fe transport
MRAILAAVALTAAVAAQAREPLETVEVIGTTPLGSAAAADKVPSNVQLATAADIRRQAALGLAGFMQRRLASVSVSDATGNPLQPDVQYRGFVSSPLLGLPQGIAVYQDGVRVNEPFGDTVDWALVPKSAIETVYLMPGSSPLFGLNALGGAISIRTKNGFTSPGTRAELTAGSFGRRHVEAEHGGSFGDRLAYFLSGAYLNEDGWRDFSPSTASQLFGSIGWRARSARLDADITHVITDLTGNGAAPLQLLQQRRAAIFTRPDRTQNALTMLSVRGEDRLSDRLTVDGNAYLRSSDIDTYNGDNSDFGRCAAAPGLLCSFDNGGETVAVDASGDPIRAAANVEGATINRSRTAQDGNGLSLQATFAGRLGKHDNRLLIGFAVDRSRIDFLSSTELGRLDATRLAIGSGIYAGGAFVDLDAETANTGVYVSDTLALTNALTLSIAGRYNHSRLRLHDRHGTALNGEHRYDRFNPSVGVTYTLGARLTLYASYSEANRTPSPVESSCASPDAPCRLPNAFVADPPLRQVVAATSEAGLRGTWAQGQWHADVFRTNNAHDIAFISAGALTNEGYFANVGRTRRDGIELSVGGTAGESLSWFANYTYLDASYRNAFRAPSPNNPEAVDGAIQVVPGDHLPLIPRGLLKAGLNTRIGRRFEAEADLLASASEYLRGDQANLTPPLAAYAVVNLSGSLKINDKTTLSLEIDNALDRDYQTFGVFGDAVSVLGSAYTDKRFVSPSAPRAAWLSLRLSL